MHEKPAAFWVVPQLLPASVQVPRAPVLHAEGKHGEARLANINYKGCDTGIKVAPALWKGKSRPKLLGVLSDPVTPARVLCTGQATNG